jgi:predicted DCC family thiol-disulfide oxidoreductase YuxK
MRTESTAPVIVFDGVCLLCSRWVRFLLKHDSAARYRFASMQSDSGRALLLEHGLDPDSPLSFLLVEDGRGYTDSDAIARVLHGLGRRRWRSRHAARSALAARSAVPLRGPSSLSHLRTEPKLFRAHAGPTRTFHAVKISSLFSVANPAPSPSHAFGIGGANGCRRRSTAHAKPSAPRLVKPLKDKTRHSAGFAGACTFAAAVRRLSRQCSP